MNQELNTLEDFFIMGLKETLDAEKQIQKALPLMAEKTSDSTLKMLFQEHLEQTNQQAERLQKILETFEEVDSNSMQNDAMKGIIADGQKKMSMKADSSVLDAAILASAQKVEHFEIACYESLMHYAKVLKQQDIADTLQKTLEEEGATAEKLKLLAQQKIDRGAL